MKHFEVSTTIDFDVADTPRSREVIRLFGLREARIREQRLTHACGIHVTEGDIVFITGASGAGKTVLLNALYEQLAPSNRLRLSDIALDADRPVIDCMSEAVFTSTEILNRAGLSEVFCMLQTPANLSAGQQHRYRIAQALAHPAEYIFADEFTGSLDRITAAVIAYHLRKCSRRSKKVFILASCHEDFLPDLRPDILIIKNLNGKMQTLYKDPQRDPARQLRL